MHDSRELRSTRDAATLVNLSPRTLEGYRLRGGGPPFYRVGGRAIRYDVGEVLAWAKRVRLISTSETDPDRPHTVRSPRARWATHSPAGSSGRK
jgi:hypothetical protein